MSARVEPVVTVRDIRDARARIAGVARVARLAGLGSAVRRTPLERSDWLSEICGCDVLLKLECWQRTRSFKVRGAFNAVAQLSAGDRGRGVVTASAGNHGLAVALAAREHGVRATVFVPADAPRIKQQRIRRLGADLVADATDYDDAERAAREFSAQRSIPLVHAFSDPAVIAGQGTIGLELLEQAPAVSTVLVPIGGGGLAGGVGTVLKAAAPGVRVIGVQSVATRAMYDAFQAGAVTGVEITPTLADGLAGCTDEVAYGLARHVVDDILLVEEHEIAAAIAGLYVHEAIVAEGAAAVVIAALMCGRVAADGPVAAIVTGGNIDGGRLSAILTGTTP